MRHQHLNASTVAFSSAVANLPATFTALTPHPALTPTHAISSLPAPSVRGQRCAFSAPPLALTHILPLVLALFRATRRFPANDPIELGSSLRTAALSAAEAVIAHGKLHRRARRFQPAPLPSEASREAQHRLREVACCIGIARRLGYLDPDAAAELMDLHARASQGISTSRS